QFTYTATGGSGTGIFSYTSSDPTVATIDPDTGNVSILKTGTTTLTATKASDTNYNSASKDCTLTVNKGNQAAITYSDITNAYGDGDFVYTASGGSGTGDFSYSSSDSTVATIDPSTGSVSILKAGTTTLTATKAADTNYNSASKTCTLTVNKAGQGAIIYDDVTKTYGDAEFVYTATGGSGTGVFSYSSSDPTVAAIDPSTGSVSILKAGTTTLTATKAEDTNYSSASKDCTLTVNKGNQAAITYNDVTKAYGDADFIYTANAGSGTGAFSYTSSDPTVATIDPATGSVSILKAGTTTLTATKAADTNYNVASDTCTLTVNKGDQAAITYNDATKTYGDAQFTYTATGGSGTGIFSYTSSDPTVATIDPDTGNVSILKTGTITLTATKASDTNYNSASKDCTLTVNKGNQAAITYSDITKAYGDGDFVYTASGGSGTGAFSYTSSDPTVATIDPVTGSVTILKVGTTTLTATKVGDTNYNAASDTCTLTVSKAVQSISVTTLPVKTTYVYGESLDVSGGAVTITYTDSSTSSAALTSEMCSAAATPDIGTRTVTVTYLGHVSTFDVAYSKAAQTAPAAPVLSVTASGITVTAPVGDTYEYSKDGGVSWQSSAYFTGLVHATSYTITARLKGTTTKNASNASSGSTATFMDITAPSLTAGAAVRTSDTAATVKFTSNEAGGYYYSIVADGAPTPSIDTSGAGINCTTAEAVITNPIGITTGAKDIYIKVKDAAGNVSNALKIDIPAYVAPVISNPPAPAVPKTEPETKPEEKKIIVLVNGKVEDAGTATTATEGDKTTTTVVLDEKKLENKLEQGADKPVVTIPVDAKVDIVVGELNGQMVKNMEKKEAVVEVKTETAAYTLPAQQINIDAVSKEIGKDVELKDIKVQIEISTPPTDVIKVVENSAKKGEFTIIAPPVDFTVKCTSENKTVEVSKFNAYVERTVAVPDGVDPSKITTGIVIEPDGTVRHVPTKIIIIDGKYYAKINSLTNSTYSVVWHPIEFNDVDNHWAKADINDMGSRMVVNGDGKGNYNPESDITRAEFAAIMVRALGLKPEMGSCQFSDVGGSDWYCGYINTAVKYKIITGYGNGKFGPMDKITREQAVTMIARAMNITGLKVKLADGEIEKLLGKFTDSSKAAQYSKTSIAACLKIGIISEDNKLISPKVNITRAEVAVFVKRLLKKSNLI
ncbi:MAG TPA: S-layer homology domain-containing protein, partial [Clostridia bacterium]|nr:S-layer homology domain-containing protein [Clostridia bacterium]